jgi:organic hydroperoxide reductase OsmC/OhrA
VSISQAHRFRAHIEWTGASSGPTRDIKAYSREFEARIDGKAAIAGSAAPQYLGDASRANPEELFLCALSGCQMLTYLALAARAKVEVISYADECEAVLAPEGGKWRITRVVLRPRVGLAPGSDAEKARDLVEQAHEGCFVARSVSCEVEIEPEFVLE